MVVGDQDLAVGVDAHPDRVVGDSFAANLAQVHAFVAEDLDAMGAIVADEDLLLVVHHHPVGELQMFGAAEFLQHCAGLVEDDDPHHFAFHHHDASLIVDGDASRVLENVGAEFAHKLPILVVDLDLVGWGPFCNYDVSGGAHHSHAIRVQELSVAFPTLSKLELEAPLLVENLDAVVVGIGDDNVVLGVHGHATRLGELALHHAKLSKLAMVDHLLALDLALGRENGH